jgi:hypothetical protein
MLSPRDEEELLRHDAELRGTDHPGYETLGRFEPQDAQRIIDRLDEEHIPYEVDAPSEVRPLPTPYMRRHYLFIYVRPEHKQKAEAITLEDFQL